MTSAQSQKPSLQLLYTQNEGKPFKECQIVWVSKDEDDYNSKDGLTGDWMAWWLNGFKTLFFFFSTPTAGMNEPIYIDLLGIRENANYLGNFP